MKTSVVILYILLLITPLANLRAQLAIPKGYFAPPIKIPLYLNGSFGEVRSNHFHSGIDLAVQQKEGLPVYATADGFISRIRVLAAGFGNALYIDHPNGFTSVYAHLQKYNDTITSYLRSNQYRLKSFEVDLFPPKSKNGFYVKKGQLIGYAGNSGASGGPHLHFELRDTKTERTINPILFGFDVVDNFNPYIDFIKIYPEGDNSMIGSSNEVTRLNLKKTSEKQYRLALKDTLTLWGNFSFGIQAFDYHQSQSNRNGFYSLKMYDDQSLFFSMVCDSFAFPESRYVNASIDYAANYDSGSRILRTKKLPGNQLSFFVTDDAKGIVSFSDNKIHEITMKVADLAGNTVKLQFWVKSQKPAKFTVAPKIPEKDSILVFRYNKVNKFENPHLSIELPAGSIYDDMIFKYRKAPGTVGMFSDIHYLQSADVPLHSRMKVSIKATRLPENLRTKALIVRVDRNGKRSSSGGSYDKGFVTTMTNIFDGYAISIDTIPPVIKPSSQNNKSKTELRFTVSDNLSGIKVYKGEVNGLWALVEWDPKIKTMIYRYDKMAKPGKNTFTLYIEDDKENKSKYTTSFTK